MAASVAFLVAVLVGIGALMALSLHKIEEGRGLGQLGARHLTSGPEYQRLKIPWIVIISTVECHGSY